MKDLDQWVCWKKESGTKVLYDPKTFYKASSTKKESWTSFLEAVEVYNKTQMYDGIGFVFTKESGIIGVDLDRVDDSRKNVFREIIEKFDSYTEQSPSKAGYHIYVMAKKNSTRSKIPSLGIEYYDSGRFFTVTGWGINTKPLKKNQEAMDWFEKKYFPEKEVSKTNYTKIISLDDQRVLDLMFSARNGATVEAIFNGRVDYGSPSEADFALINHIAFYTQDVDQIIRIMKSSALYREKFEREDYLPRQIEAVLATLKEIYTPRVEFDMTDFMKKKKTEPVEIVKNKAGEKRVSKKQNDMTLDDYEKVYKDLGYKFALNQLDDSIEVNGEPITDIYEAVIRSNLDNIGITNHRKSRDKISDIAYKNKYHPIKRYLNGLKWDGQDHIKTLCDHFKDDANLFETYFRKWIVGAVAKIYQRAEQKTFILNGPQRIGKSYFAGWLGRALEDGKYFIEGTMDGDDKDTLVRLTNRWIWEIAELSGVVGRTARGNIKNILTKEDVSVRKSYGRNDLRKKTITSFIGTVNDASGFLNDPTGSYRFMVCTLTEIDRSYSKTMNPNQIWAQAYELYKDNYDWTFDRNELEKIEENNKKYTMHDSLEDLIDANYSFDNPNSRIMADSIREQVVDFGWKENPNAFMARLGIYLSKKGVVSRRNKDGRFYEGISLKKDYEKKTYFEQ